MSRLFKKAEPIRDLDHWQKVGGPKKDQQWVEGRSAYETARFWLDAADAFPASIGASLGAHPDFGTIHTWTAEPEVRLKFDERKGEPRNTDLLIVAEDDFGPFLIAVEAKADEPFGETVSDQLAAALESRFTNPRSQALERIEDLAKAVLRPRDKGLPSIKSIRYQLLTATAGALVEGSRQKTNRVVLLIQEFCSDRTDEDLQARNAADLAAFVSRVSGQRVMEVVPGEVLGPFKLPAAALFTGPPQLYVLKVTCDVRTGV
jgi:hypothetical protein